MEVSDFCQRGCGYDLINDFVVILSEPLTLSLTN